MDFNFTIYFTFKEFASAQHITYWYVAAGVYERYHVIVTHNCH